MSLRVIVTNLGSPASPAQGDVRRFLIEFLTDPYVIDLPSPVRQFLVKGLIAPTRSRRSSRAYQSIWSCEEGPLRYFTEEIAKELRNVGTPAVSAMRYGEPSLRDAIEAQPQADHIVLVPLFPQHADSTITTTVQHARKLVGDRKFSVVPPFFDRAEYLDALLRHTRQELTDSVEHLVISFHSLPERHITKADPTSNHCLKNENCCEVRSESHATCYRHQCMYTANFLGKHLGLPYSVSFQSRLGRLKWLEPSTVATISNLATEGIRRIAVVCPAFTVDNLETLEEIGIQARELFLSLGGEELQLISSLNSDPRWIRCLVNLINEQISI
ncbi:MAG: ferrochelatase [Gammaproteobacteria bacterium]|nr:ferrochelatase [Gammaproteobacteria bacterium]MYD80117.1 ferrochelatase [Gammaproteobacteria bacterium]